MEKPPQPGCTKDKHPSGPSGILLRPNGQSTLSDNQKRPGPWLSFGANPWLRPGVNTSTNGCASSQHQIASTLIAANPSARPIHARLLCFCSARTRGRSSMLATWRKVPLDRAVQMPLNSPCPAELPTLLSAIPDAQPIGVPSEKISTKVQNFQLGRSDCDREQPNANAARPLCASTAKITETSRPLPSAEPMPRPSITEWKQSAKNRKNDFTSATGPPVIGKAAALESV
mmetsp:Transcript_22730/g.52000  ORF Transcript_22730/g.52000 Transcript_22730/m.52000 type:complete len:230 (-) Transcript_22730:826-1515(-)